jgi:uncharacterized pyridoxamine 5'-phosphate oxidase family protein
MKAIATALVIFMLGAILPLGVTAWEAGANDHDKEAEMREVHDFIKGCGHYFLATVDGDQPKVRPFGTVAIFDGKLYIQTGKKKDVSKQLARNPKIEMCAYDGKGAWVRVQAVAVNDDSLEAKRFMLDAYPELKSMYSAEDANTQVLYLKDVKATFFSFSGGTRTVEF